MFKVIDHNGFIWACTNQKKAEMLASFLPNPSFFYVKKENDKYNLYSFKTKKIVGFNVVKYFGREENELFDKESFDKIILELISKHNKCIKSSTLI